MAGGAAEAAPGPTRTLEEVQAQERAEAAPPLPAFPADYEAQIRAIPIPAPPPPGPDESAEATLSAWARAAATLQLEEWMAGRVRDAAVFVAQGRVRPGTWAEAASQGPAAFDGWLAAQNSLGAMADRAAAGQRIADEAVARAVDYKASYAAGQAEPDARVGRVFTNAAASYVAGGQLVVMAFDKLGDAFVRGPRTGGAGDPLADPTSEAFGRLPLQLRLTLSRAAARLPAWPAEPVIHAWDAQGRWTGPKPPILRLAQEAKRRGLWPENDATWPLPGNTRDVARQLRAMLQVGLETEAAAAAPGPVYTSSPDYTPQPGSYTAPDRARDTPQAGNLTDRQLDDLIDGRATSRASAPTSSGAAGSFLAVTIGAAALLGLVVALRRRRRRKRPS